MKILDKNAIYRACNEMDEYKEKRVNQISEIGETRLCCSVNA